MDFRNNVELYGHFCTVEAHTDCSVDVKEKVEWKKKDDHYCATFLSVDDAWIEVRVSDFFYENKFKRLSNPYCKIEGRLCTEVGRGNGIVSNYILID